MHRAEHDFDVEPRTRAVKHAEFLRRVDGVQQAVLELGVAPEEQRAERLTADLAFTAAEEALERGVEVSDRPVGVLRIDDGDWLQFRDANGNALSTSSPDNRVIQAAELKRLPSR